MKLKSLQDLYVAELKDLYSAEHQITKALPKMIKSTSSPDLRDALSSHLEETQEHVRRLEQVFEHLNTSPGRKKCKGMEGLIEEGQELMTELEGSDAADAGVVAAAQKVEHYEMASYGTARAYARLLGHEESAELLGQTLEEEKMADEKLSQIAESHINMEAIEGEMRESART